MKRIILLASCIILLLAVLGYYFIFIYSKNNHRLPQNETCLLVNIDSLVNTYSNNETLADSLYLNKCLELEGEILTIEQNNKNQKVVTIKSTDEFMNVSFTLQENNKNTNLALGKKVKIKGICNGALTDVVLSQGFVE
ncbi:MAG: hypothetical protein ORN85_04365 [Sediminibacterium sp.]|nr:hypothetical protein [Sediminibacterium sp.]